jgi:hypothetical protein
MKRIIKYNRLPYQREFHEATKFYNALFAGFGGGKTYSLCMKLLHLCELNKNMAGGLLCPTLKMFKRDVLPTLKEICGQFGIEMKYHRQDSYIYFPDTRSTIFVFHAEDDGLSIKGPNLAFMLINEVTLCSLGAFQAAISRVRLKKAKFRQVAMSGTPEGFNWTYDFLIANKRDDADVFFGDMRLNTYVAADYAKMLTDSYDDQMVQQYVEGKFVNVNSLAALHKFHRAKHVRKVERIKGHPIWVSCDFNVSPMTATLYNRMPDKEQIKLRGFDEIYIKGSDTHELCRVLKEKTDGNDPVTIYPDPAGGHRDTRSGTTDIDIFHENGFMDVKYRRKIYSVRDCLNAANAFLFKNQCVLDAENCRNTIMDFEQCSMKPGTGSLDKSDLNRTHFVDGFKNMIEYEFPLGEKAGGWKQVSIR